MLSYSRPRAPTFYCSSQPAACFSPFLQSRGLASPSLFNPFFFFTFGFPSYTSCQYADTTFHGSPLKASNLDIYYYLWWFEFTRSHFTCTPRVTSLGNKFLTLIIHKVRDSQKMQAVWKGLLLTTEISKTILNAHFEGGSIYVFTMSRNKLYDGGYWSKLARSDLVHLRLDDFKVAVKFWALTHPPQKKTWFTIVSGG